MVYSLTAPEEGIEVGEDVLPDDGVVRANLYWQPHEVDVLEVSSCQ